MEASGQSHAPVALPPGKNPRAPIGYVCRYVCISIRTIGWSRGQFRFL